jgi:2-dehydro-3-deoxygalactonokinase
MIGVDWGSSGLRAYRLGDDGNIVDLRIATSGIASLTPTDYPAVLRSHIGDWLDLMPAATVLLSGMVGSRQGWREAPYVNCPAALTDLVQNLCPADLGDGRMAHIVPGLTCRAADDIPDVMRGEETQIYGLDGVENATVCLPGTHSKHVHMQMGRIVGFATAMTGELFAQLRGQGLIAAMLQGAGEADVDTVDVAFSAGVTRSGQPGGLLHHLFGVRTRRLFNELCAAAGADYLSGILIGHELRATDWSGRVIIVGTGALASRYRMAFAILGIAADPAPDHAAARGLYRLSRLFKGECHD